MLKAVCAIWLLFIPVVIWGQGMSEMKTLFKDDARISGFVSINAGASPFAGHTVGYIGGDGALVLNNFFLGGFGSRNIEHQVIPDVEYYIDKKLGLSQGGFYSGINFRSKKLLQYSLCGQIGWGRLSLHDNLTKEILTRDRINTLTPILQVKLNLTSYVQLCTSLSYQFLLGIDYPNLKDDDFQGLYGSISVRFGWF